MPVLPSVTLNLGRCSFLRGTLLNLVSVVLGARMSGYASSSPRHVEAKPTSSARKVLLA